MSAVDQACTRVLERVRSQIDALGPRPPWWRPILLRRWMRTGRAIGVAALSELVEEMAAVITRGIDDAMQDVN